MLSKPVFDFCSGVMLFSCLEYIYNGTCCNICQYQGSESSCSSLHEIPMEMDLTASGPPISDDDTDLETMERKYITVFEIFDRKVTEMFLKIFENEV